MISFTENGSRLAETIGTKLCGEYEITHAKKYQKAKDAKDAKEAISEPLTEWTKRQFETQEGLVFVGAVGIAVRAIAPYVRAKEKDPAVLAIDEQGRYCIPLLSGHLGGANELAKIVAEKIGALAVITTATDLNHKWAVDVFAKKNHLAISDMKKAKEISARILGGEKISVYAEEPFVEILGSLPAEIERIPEAAIADDETAIVNDEMSAANGKAADIVIGVRKKSSCAQALYLIPKTVSLGIGCRKGMSEERVESAIRGALEEYGIFPESIEKLASIDLKKEERGILSCAKKFGWEYETYTADELNGMAGNFAKSSFVQSVTGVDNVCERSAVCASAGGELLVPKQAADGVTVAAAVRKCSIQFE